MHTTSRTTPPSRPRDFLPTPNYATDARQTLSRHRPTSTASPQRLSAWNIYPSREAYRAFVHIRRNALKPAQLFPTNSHSTPVFAIVWAHARPTFCKRIHPNRRSRSKVIPFLVHFFATRHPLFQHIFAHTFAHTNKTTTFSSTKLCTHMTNTPIHLLQLVEPVSETRHATYSTFSQQITHISPTKIDCTTYTTTPDRLRLYNNH
jgi:hypothetical protein